jgi:hypothetical protein
MFEYSYGGSSGRYSDSYTGTGGRGPARDTYSDDPPPVTSRAVEESKPAVTKQRSTGTRKKAPKPVQEVYLQLLLLKYSVLHYCIPSQVISAVHKAVAITPDALAY